MLVPALRYAARFGMRAVVVFYVWYSLWSTHLILKGGHLPLAATNISVCYPTFLGGAQAPAFWGKRNFRTIVFEISLTSNVSLEEQLAVKSTYCIDRGCQYCVQHWYVYVSDYQRLFFTLAWEVNTQASHFFRGTMLSFRGERGQNIKRRVQANLLQSMHGSIQVAFPSFLSVLAKFNFDPSLKTFSVCSDPSGFLGKKRTILRSRRRTRLVKIYRPWRSRCRGWTPRFTTTGQSSWRGPPLAGRTRLHRSLIS